MNFTNLLVTIANVLFTKDPSPTMNNPLVREVSGYTPPTGWMIAGLLLLLLVSMIYRQIIGFVKRILKKKG